MNNEAYSLILDKIKQYDRIIISRHVRPDGDAVGSTLGLREVIKTEFPDKEVYVVSDDYSEYLSFLGYEDDIETEDIDGSLQIVLDTADEERISNSRFRLAKELIKIDHHIDVCPYGDISFVDDKRSSACEIIAEFCIVCGLKINSYAAYCLYAGMVTDSGRFKFQSTTGETLRIASVLLDTGIDTEMLFCNLYLDDYEYIKFKSIAYNLMQITPNGVAYLVIPKALQTRYGISQEQASSSVSLLESIKGSIVWMVIIENNDGTYRARLRSRFASVNKLAEKYRGGGHEKASGASLLDKKEIKSLLDDADALIKNYKENNEDWI